MALSVYDGEIAFSS